MNKLLFIWEELFCDPVKIVADNHKDLEDYLRKTYDWYWLSVSEKSVSFRERPGYEIIDVPLEWVKHI